MQDLESKAKISSIGNIIKDIVNFTDNFYFSSNEASILVNHGEIVSCYIDEKKLEEIRKNNKEEK